MSVASRTDPPHEGRDMDSPHALAALAALGQPTRLDIFRLLMRHEPGGVPAGAIAAMVGYPQNTVSTHLGILARSGLVRGVRDGRFIHYFANVDGMRALVGFLINDCCEGRPELCDLAKARPNPGCGC